MLICTCICSTFACVCMGVRETTSSYRVSWPDWRAELSLSQTACPEISGQVCLVWLPFWKTHTHTLLKMTSSSGSAQSHTVFLALEGAVSQHKLTSTHTVKVQMQFQPDSQLDRAVTTACMTVCYSVFDTEHCICKWCLNFFISTQCFLNYWIK